jgi:hypothetical protein
MKNLSPRDWYVLAFFSFVAAGAAITVAYWLGE